MIVFSLHLGRVSLQFCGLVKMTWQKDRGSLFTQGLIIGLWPSQEYLKVLRGYPNQHGFLKSIFHIYNLPKKGWFLRFYSMNLCEYAKMWGASASFFFSINSSNFVKNCSCGRGSKAKWQRKRWIIHQQAEHEINAITPMFREVCWFFNPFLMFFVDPFSARKKKAAGQISQSFRIDCPTKLKVDRL